MSRTPLLILSALALCIASAPVGAAAPGFPLPLGGDGYSSPCVADFSGAGSRRHLPG